MTTETDADLVEMLRIWFGPDRDLTVCVLREDDDFRDNMRRILTWANARAAKPITPTDRQMLDAVLGRLATLPGWTLVDYSEFLGRLLAWADGRRDAAVMLERGRLLEAEVAWANQSQNLAARDAQIARLREEVERYKQIAALEGDERVQAIRMARTALSGGGMAGWRPLEGVPDVTKAPWDGKAVLLYWQHWSDEPMVGCYRLRGWFAYDAITDNTTSVGPTHWMPLPSAPRDAGRVEVGE